MIEVFLWIILTLFIVSLSAVIAKKYSTECIIATFAASVVIANILANKIVVFLEWTVPAGVIIYSSTFLLIDFLLEFFGKKEAKKAIWIGFFVNIILIISIWIAIKWAPAGFWSNQEAFVLTLSNTWRIILASLIAYIVSQNYNVWSYLLIKKKTRGRFLWLRNNTSTIVSQLIDTSLFVIIAFYGLFPILPMIIGMLIVKSIIAIIDTPFLYMVNYFYKKKIKTYLSQFKLTTPWKI